MAILKLFTRRSRCSVQGCKKPACYGLGLRGNDYLLCEDHVTELISDAYRIVAEKNLAKKQADGAEIETEEETTSEVVETPQETTEETAEREYRICRYCGEKFYKDEYTVQQFNAHVRKCKKDHENDVPSDK